MAILMMVTVASLRAQEQWGARTCRFERPRVLKVRGELDSLAAWPTNEQAAGRSRGRHRLRCHDCGSLGLVVLFSRRTGSSSSTRASDHDAGACTRRDDDRDYTATPPIGAIAAFVVGAFSWGSSGTIRTMHWKKLVEGSMDTIENTSACSHVAASRSSAGCSPPRARHRDERPAGASGDPTPWGFLLALPTCLMCSSWAASLDPRPPSPTLVPQFPWAAVYVHKLGIDPCTVGLVMVLNL
jgi:hypothetical protein